MHASSRRIALHFFSFVLGLVPLAAPDFTTAQPPERANFEGQPLAANMERVGRALDAVGTPLTRERAATLARPTLPREFDRSGPPAGMR
jgi:hypothetical protein